MERGIRYALRRCGEEAAVAKRLHALQSGDRIGSITWLNATARAARGTKLRCFFSCYGHLCSSSCAVFRLPPSSLSAQKHKYVTYVYSTLKLHPDISI